MISLTTIQSLTDPAPADPAFSPLLLSDRLISLAQAADQAGYARAARRLVSLAEAVCDEAPLKTDRIIGHA